MTSRAEYQRGIMDAFSDPEVEEVVGMTSAQVGKTETVNNVVGFHIDHDPGPMLIVNPTLEMSDAWEADRFEPMRRDTPSLREKVPDAKTRDAGNTKRHKKFPGGHLTTAGANSPPSLAGRPVRLVLCDEVDRWPVVAGSQEKNEGDPINLAVARTKNFYNRKIGYFSTPTLKGLSRIERLFEASDKRYFHVPCPHCKHEHVLRWGNVVWGADTPARGDWKKAVFKCPNCSGFYTSAQRNAMVRRGRWIATAPFYKRAGFHICELYSPWRTLEQIVASFLEAKDNPQTLQVWINTTLGEAWGGGTDTVTDAELLARCEPYRAEVPARVLYLTAGVDVQTDRIAVEVVGWAGGEESWSIDWREIWGDPDIPEGVEGSPWTQLTDHLRRAWKHELGIELAVSATCIDTGGTGTNTAAIYNYVKRHKGARVFGVKGKGGDGVPIVGSPSRKRTGKSKRPIDLFIVGTDQAKSVVYKRLKQADQGAGYCHFPTGREADFFKQITAEKLETKWVKGFPRLTWFKPDKARNEALDCRVYAWAALLITSPQMDKIAFRRKAELERRKQSTAQVTAQETAQVEQPAPAPEEAPAQDASAPVEHTNTKKARRPRARTGFVNAWRN